MPKRIFLLALSVFLPSNVFCQIELRSYNDALKIALANDVERSLQTLGAQESVRMAQKNIGGFLPVIDFCVNDAAKAQKDTDDAKSKTIEFGVTQKIFNGGKTFLEWRMQKEKSFYQFLSAQKANDGYKNQLLKAYYASVLLELKSRLLNDSLKNAWQVILTSQLEEEQGMITKMEYLETLLEYKKMELEGKSAQDDCENSKWQLKRMMGLKQEHNIALLETQTFERALESYPLVEDLNEKERQCVQSAIQNSVDLKLAEAELNWAQKMRSMQKRFFLPSVSVRGGVSFSGRNYPLTSPTYSIKVILGFDDNPWLKTTVSSQVGFNKGKMNSMTDSISGQTEANTIYFNQMRLNKIEIAQKKLGLEKAKRQIEENVCEAIQKIQKAQENFLLNLESVKLKERKLLLSKIQLEQGKIKRSDYLEDLNECAKQKIQALNALKERDCLTKELEAMSNLNF